MTIRERGLEVVCAECDGPLTPEELKENDGQCDLCHDYFVGTYSLSDMLDERAQRLARIASVTGHVETIGGSVYALVPFEDLNTELRRIGATISYVAKQMENDHV